MSKEIERTVPAFLGVAAEIRVIPLLSVAEEYFGLDADEAKRNAREGRLPVTAFRLGRSQKSPWVIHLDELQKLVKTRFKEAQDARLGAID